MGQTIPTPPHMRIPVKFAYGSNQLGHERHYFWTYLSISNQTFSSDTMSNRAGLIVNANSDWKNTRCTNFINKKILFHDIIEASGNGDKF